MCVAEFEFSNVIFQSVTLFGNRARWQHFVFYNGASCSRYDDQSLAIYFNRLFYSHLTRVSRESFSSMSNHDELVAEMAVAEKMTMMERLKLAKKRRAQQLKTYAQYEKELNKNASSGGSGNKSKAGKKDDTRSKGTGRLQFTGSILLLDAAARNDVAEGTLRSFDVLHA